MTVYPTGADLAHEIHAHGITAQGEKGAVPKAQYPTVPPDEIEGDGEQGIGEILAPQSHRVSRQVQPRGFWYQEIEYRNHDTRYAEQCQHDTAAPIPCEQTQHALALRRPSLLRKEASRP